MPTNRRQFMSSFGGVIPLFGAASPVPFSRECGSEFLPWETASANPGIFTRRKIETEILVAGGGLAGICAAIAAARQGVSVVLVQDRSRLGGNSSSEIRMHVLGANSSQETRLWRETGLIEEFKLTDAAANPQRSFEMWDLMLYQKVLAEKKIQLLLDTSVTEATVRDNRIVVVQAISPSLEEHCEISAEQYIDCTGDAVLAAAAGARMMRGREGRDVHGEALAPAKGDLKTMGNSLLFFARRHERPMPFQPPEWARRFQPQDFIHRPIRSYEYGYWWIELGGEMDTIKDNRRIRHELLCTLLGVWDYIKNSGRFPDASPWALEWVGMIPGKRESRRIAGDHILKQQELERAEPFPDRVAYGGWPMDDHPPAGMNASDLPPAKQIYFKQPYSIPLRSLYSVSLSNLWMAGRNLSASHVALSSTRVMATCATQGQAVGTAAAWCLRRRSTPRQLVEQQAECKALQQVLLRDDQALLGIRNEDPDDLARRARVRASHENPEGPAMAVVDGWNRDIGDGLSHQWQALMSEIAPWIELSWDTAQTIRQVQITFDSGLNRLLYLTGQDSEYNRQVRRAQPETIADYVIEARVQNLWVSIIEVKDNYLRLVRHTFEPVQAQAVRVRVLKTQGDPRARIFEIRCYA
jgi:hypothetical protein